MCRLALINNSGIRYIEENYSLLNLFNYLQATLGGHGNGICIIDNDNKFYIEKGVNLTNKTIINIIKDNIDNLKWVIYHTRLASVGKISDANCHPFKLRNKVLCMNGTEFWAAQAIKTLNCSITDTELILRLSDKNLYTCTQKCNSVFIGMDKNKIFANRNNGDLKYLDTNNNGKIFASDFPENIISSEQIYIAPKHWIDGKKINTEKLTPFKKTKLDYSYLSFCKI